MQLRVDDNYIRSRCYSCGDIHCALGPPLAIEIEEIEAFFNTIAQFTKARSIHSAFYQ
jgi:hypothetical protein